MRPAKPPESCSATGGVDSYGVSSTETPEVALCSSLPHLQYPSGAAPEVEATLPPSSLLSPFSVAEV